MRHFLTRAGLALLFGALGVPAAYALPRAASVPGGVALIALGDARAAPRAWFGEQRVLVARDKGQWVAVVGLPLDLLPGRHELRLEGANGTPESTRHFAVRVKHYRQQRITLKGNSKVFLAPADEERAVREIATIGQLKRHWRDADPGVEAFQLPAEGRLTSRFGLRRVFNDVPRAPHAGLDFAVPRGTPIKAAAGGKVLAADDYFFNGKSGLVDHGHGLISLYCHLERIDVQAGERVVAQQEIGLSGMSGRASGPHLHWSVILNGAMVDPELFITKN